MQVNGVVSAFRSGWRFRVVLAAAVLAAGGCVSPLLLLLGPTGPNVVLRVVNNSDNDFSGFYGSARSATEALEVFNNFDPNSDTLPPQAVALNVGAGQTGEVSLTCPLLVGVGGLLEGTTTGVGALFAYDDPLLSDLINQVVGSAQFDPNQEIVRFTCGQTLVVTISSGGTASAGVE